MSSPDLLVEAWPELLKGWTGPVVAALRGYLGDGCPVAYAAALKALADARHAD